MFKKIVASIAAITVQEDVNAVFGMIETAFQQDKISWKEHEVLYTIVEKIKVN